ncbi:histidine kinase-like ATPase [Suillus discolor]|uniref:Histidine kinase-like ATPase n=1 Tax=Suillus discolor TaxID=1912936 RepID=A0A9P7JNS0_9AGAM|nr:histidine kinase-like ATPase [Suillus discolor]KAG2093345.1 histidine kinase-like ATPase [Suillus discolor]
MASGCHSPSPESPGPQPIRRLHECLINLIPAGKIIHGLASALKELLENSLNDGSTSIQVTVKDGGKKLLQIQDNGCGIRLAERFTTSKLTTFSQADYLREALPSISHVAHPTVPMKTKSTNCARKAAYVDGGLVPSQAGLETSMGAIMRHYIQKVIAYSLFWHL